MPWDAMPYDAALPKCKKQQLGRVRDDPKREGQVVGLLVGVDSDVGVVFRAGVDNIYTCVYRYA